MTWNGTAANFNQEMMYDYQHNSTRLGRTIRDLPCLAAIVHAAATSTRPSANHGHTPAASQLSCAVG